MILCLKIRKHVYGKFIVYMYVCVCTYLCADTYHMPIVFCIKINK